MGTYRKAAALLGATLFTLGLATPAAAKPPRDNLLNPPKSGNYMHAIGYTVGAQLSLENRSDLEEGMSMQYSRADLTYSFGYKEASFHADTRVFLFTFGASAGYREVHRDHTLVPGADFDGDGTVEPDDSKNNIENRKAREGEGLQGNQTFPWYEGRARFTLPLGPLFMLNTATIRNEDRNKNSFDWFHATAHDGGALYKYDGILFFRHRDFGAIGPAVQYLDLPRDGGRDTELNFGFVYGTRPGFIERPTGSDLFLLRFLYGPSEEFGFHGYSAPIYVLAVYRASINLD